MEFLARFSFSVESLLRALIAIVAVECVLVTVGTSIAALFRNSLEMLVGTGLVSGGGYTALGLMIVLPVAGLCLVVNTKSDLRS